MIVFPLMYPEVFERFKISPPRGVLFYGPPGKQPMSCLQIRCKALILIVYRGGIPWVSKTKKGKFKITI